MNFARLGRIAGHRWRSLLHAGRADRELSGELAFHFEHLVEENIAGGMPPEEASLAARRALGNIALLEEQCRDQRRVSWLRDLAQDAQYAWRAMRQSPGFTAIAAVSLALGIGANTALLGVADAMWFGRLPFPQPDRLMFIRTYSQDNPNRLSNASQPDYFAVGDGTHAFASLGCSLADQKNLGASEAASAENAQAPERLFGQGFSAGLFEALGVAPMLGRAFAAADFHRGPPTVVILSERLWRRRFGADPQTVGRRIPLNGVSTEVIGVMPANFHFGEERPEYWVPMQLQRIDWQTGIRYFIVAGRLKPGVSREQAQGELDQVAAQLAERFPDTHTGWRMRLQPVREALFGWARRSMLTLESAVLLMLLIACANVAGLLLARGAARRRELAMRAALGAGRTRILRQLLAESLLLALIGGLLGMAVAAAALRAIPLIEAPPDAPRLQQVPFNWHMLLLAGLTSLAVAAIFGSGPAIASLRQDLIAALKDSSSGSSAPGSRLQPRSVLVAAQIALAFVLLTASALCLQSFLRISRRDLNFTPRGLLTFEFRLPTWQALRITGSYQGLPYVRTQPGELDKFQRILDRLRSLPGAESVAGVSNPPVNSLIVPTIALTVEGASRASGETSYFLVTPGFFSTMKAAILRGRELADSDTAGAAWVAVVNETAARLYWPGQDPIGQRFRLDSGPEEQARTVIGVVRDIPLGNLSLNPAPIVYGSYWQQPSRAGLPWGLMQAQMTFLLRGHDDPPALAQAAQRAVAEIDPETPLANIAPMEQYTREWTGQIFYYTTALGALAFIATLLAAIGAYGVMSCHVAQRTPEIGIRLALGARSWQIFGLLGGSTLRIVAAGLGAGFLAGLPLTGLLARDLWGVAPGEPTAFLGAFAVLLSAAGLASFGPLRRSARMTPMRALSGR